MKFFPNGLITVAAAVAFIFAQHTEANMTAALSEATEVEKLLVGKEFQDSQQAIIMSAKDIESLAAREVIEGMQKLALQCQADGVPALAVNTVLEGILAATRLVIASGHQAVEAIDKAFSLKENPEAAIKVLKEVLKADEDLMFIAGVPVHDAQGSALAQLGGAAQPGLKKSIIPIQKSGQVGFEAREVAEEIATLGLRAGGAAAEAGCQAAREVVHTAGIVVMDLMTQAAQNAFEGLRNAALRKSREVQIDLVPGIINSLKTSISTNNPDALKAISKIDDGLKAVLGKLTKKSAIDAVKIMSEGIKSTIVETADALAVAKESIKKAATLADEDTEAAVAAVRQGIKLALDEVLSGSAGGYLGLGAAGQFGGKAALDGLIPAVLEIEYGRVAAYEDIKLAEKTIITGLRAKGLAAVQGTLAAVQTCDAAGSALFTQFVDGAEIAFEVLKNI